MMFLVFRNYRCIIHSLHTKARLISTRSFSLVMQHHEIQAESKSNRCRIAYIDILKSEISLVINFECCNIKEKAITRLIHSSYRSEVHLKSISLVIWMRGSWSTEDVVSAMTVDAKTRIQCKSTKMVDWPLID